MELNSIKNILVIDRIYNLNKLIGTKRVLIIYGPRRVGKTTLLKAFLANSNLKFKLDTGENIKTQSLFQTGDIEELKSYTEGYDLLAIDEAQYISNIGPGLKILHDYMPGLRIVITGSSSFNISRKIGEPLTGRKKTLTLYPLSQSELLSANNRYELEEKLEDFLIFGSYPEVITARSRKEKIFILNELVESYLLKDIFTIENIRSPAQFLTILKLIAFQVGSEVSLNELAAKGMVDVKTVARYIDLLEKSFVIKKLGAYSRNMRDEVTTKAKYYFIDNGVRNAVISQFNTIENRDDKGALFENFLIMERLKSNTYRERNAQLYFWRTRTGQEIDLVEEFNEKLTGYEIKWSSKSQSVREHKRIPPKWNENYKQAGYKVIDRKNYFGFTLGK